jgi:hypothetical protein
LALFKQPGDLYKLALSGRPFLAPGGPLQRKMERIKGENRQMRNEVFFIYARVGIMPPLLESGSHILVNADEEII